MSHRQSGLSTTDMANAAARQPEAATATSVSDAQPLQRHAQDRTDSQRGGAVYRQRSGAAPLALERRPGQLRHPDLAANRKPGGILCSHAFRSVVAD